MIVARCLHKSSILLAALAPLAGGARAAAPAGSATSVPMAASCPATEADISVMPLPGLTRAMHLGGTVPVLMIGSTPLQPGTAPSAWFYPYGMAHLLENSVKGIKFSFNFRMKRSQDAAGDLQSLRSELAAKSYPLVIWQTGTIDAVRDEGVEEFYQTLLDGAGLITKKGGSLVLVQPQYSRFLTAQANLPPYLDAMQMLGAMPGVMLFHRYDIMHDWADSGAIDLEDAEPDVRPQVAAHLHTCLGQELGQEILQIARLHR